MDQNYLITTSSSDQFSSLDGDTGPFWASLGGMLAQGVATWRFRTGPLGRSDGHRACRPLRIRRFPLDTAMPRVSNACSGEPGEVPDNEVNAHLESPADSAPA